MASRALRWASRSQVDGISATVVGVMPASFRVERRPELWVPVGPAHGRPHGGPGNHPGLIGIARLKRGVSFGEGRSGLETVGRRSRKNIAENRACCRRPDPMQHWITHDVRGSLWLLMGAVALVLLIAAANVGSLMLAREPAGCGARHPRRARCRVGPG
jgi:hypothetical protein